MENGPPKALTLGKTTLSQEISQKTDLISEFCKDAPGLGGGPSFAAKNACSRNGPATMDFQLVMGSAKEGVKNRQFPCNPMKVLFN